MATYVISDIHGGYELFIKLLEKILCKILLEIIDKNFI